MTYKIYVSTAGITSILYSTEDEIEFEDMLVDIGMSYTLKGTHAFLNNEETDK